MPPGETHVGPRGPRLQPGHGRTVLVADDEEALRRSLALLLEDAGYRVVQASNGLEAIEVVRLRGPEIHVALLDVMMPHLGGLAAALEIRSASTPIPVIFMTGFTKEDVAQTGAVVLSKPFSHEALLEAIARVAGG
jgi:CheY-like chemotaxis protein